MNYLKLLTPRNVLMPIWTIACFYGFFIVLEWSLEHYPNIISVFIPLYFLVWLVIIYLGHAIIDKVIKWTSS